MQDLVKLNLRTKVILIPMGLVFLSTCLLLGVAMLLQKHVWRDMVAQVSLPQAELLIGNLKKFWQQEALEISCILFCVIAATFFLSHYLLNRLLSTSLNRIVASIRSIAQGDYHYPDPANEIKELRTIVGEVKKLAAQLEERDRRIRQEIAERIQTEKELRNAKEEWERTFNAITDVVCIQDTAMKVRRVNQAVTTHFGLTPEELVGKHCYEIFRKGLGVCPGCPELKTIRDLKPHRCEMRHEALGKIFEITVSPVLNEENELEGIVHIAKDITEQRKLEARISHSNKIEAIGTLAGGIAHDFNNILSAILGYAEVGRMRLPADNPAKSDIEGVIKAGQRARELVKHILAFSRKTEHALVHVPIQSVTKEAMKLLRASIPANIEFRTNFAAPYSYILADPSHVHQIIMNLGTNAYHAMQENGGVLTVSLQEISAGERGLADLPAARCIELEISDTGHGILPEIRDKIFDPYFTTKEIGKGTGLGLSVVHGIVKNYNGTVTVDSAAGNGATFRIYFPLVSTEPEEKGTDDLNELLQTGNERVMCVDDEADILYYTRKMLEALGYSVTTFTSSLDALVAFTRSPESFDLIITDMAMPHLTGIDLSRQLLERRPGLPIILYTGYNETVTREKALKCGISSFLFKPVARSELLKTIRQVLDRRPESVSGECGSRESGAGD
jgi:PAS domain S-box-containing protein